MSVHMITSVRTGDYDAWRAMFDEDPPRVREAATSARVFRKADDPDHVFILLEFDSVAVANDARDRLLRTGVLDRFDEVYGPAVVEEAARGTTGVRGASEPAGVGETR